MWKQASRQGDVAIGWVSPGEEESGAQVEGKRWQDLETDRVWGLRIGLK